MTDLAEILTGIEQLTVAEKLKLASIIMETTQAPTREYSNLLSTRTNGVFCPSCNNRGVKNGTVRGVQRYKCKTCNTSFGDTNGTVMAYSGKDLDLWVAYLKLFVRGLSITQITRELGISKTTAYSWRIKILEKMKDATPARSLEGIVEADETYVAESFKGNHNGDGFDMPRRSRSRGKQVSLRGISHQQVSIVCATDRSNNATMKITGRGRINETDLTQAFDGVLADNATLCTDKHSSYRAYARENNITLKQVDTNQTLNGVYHIQHINSFHSRFKKFMRKFNGVSTKHLELYLAWFLWEQDNKNLTEKAKHEAIIRLMIS